MANHQGPHWIVGPILYDGGKRGPKNEPTLFWEFVAGTASGKIRRYALVYHSKTRTFRHYGRGLSQWDAAHAENLVKLYRPVAVLRSDLPKGTILTALRAMLPAKEIAAATALSIGVE